MTDIVIDTGLGRNSIANSAITKPSGGFFKKVSELGRALIQPLTSNSRRAIQYARFLTVTSPPTEALRKIDDLAVKGLQRAAVRGIESDRKAANIQGDLDELLIQRKSSEPPPLNSAVVGPVAEIPGIQPDAEVTRAPDLQARVDAIDWGKKVVLGQVDLVNKATVFTVIMLMRDRCGIQEKDNQSIQNLTKRSSEKDSPSVWNLFLEKYPNLSFFQKFKAAWVYWIYYKTSIVSKGIAAVAKAAINKVMGLTAENSNTRTVFFNEVLKNANQFLISDIQATKDFAYGRARGDLEECRDRPIEEFMGTSLKAVCKAFSEELVKKDFRVPFFETMKNIPGVGILFEGFEWFVNRFIIQSNLKSWILPNVLESGVQKGLESTQPHNLPFAINLTQFFTSQLEKLRKGGSDQPLATAIPGITELLSPVIKNLKEAIALEPYKTSKELREAIEKGEKWYWDKKIDSAIETATIDGCNRLFNIFNEPLKCRELLANLLELSARSFCNEVKDQKLLEAEYREERLKFARLAEEVVKEIVSTAVAKQVNGEDPEAAKRVAKESFAARKEITHYTVEQLRDLCHQMGEKISASELNPTPENNVQTDIATFFQTMQVFANRKEIQDKIETLAKVEREPIWRILTPIYERAAKIEEEMLKLQELQDYYPAHASVAKQMTAIQELLTSIQQCFHAKPRELQNPLNEALDRSVEEITKCLGPSSPASRILRSYISDISQEVEKVVREQNVIDALIVLSPPRLEPSKNVQEGYLDRLLNYERGVHQKGFKPRECMSEIRKHLEHFPADERTELETLIGTGSNLQSKWGQLENVLQRIYDKHQALKNRAKITLDEKIATTSAWTQDKITKYTGLKEDNHSKMQAQIRLISAEVDALHKEIQRAKPSFPTAITPLGIKVVAGLASAFGGAIGSTVGPVGTFVGAGVGAFISSYFAGHTHNSREPTVLKPLIFSAAGFAAGGTLAYFPFQNQLWNYLGSGAGASFSGWNTLQTSVSVAQKRVNDQVMDIFKNGYNFILAPRIYKAATTRTLKALSKK